MTTLPGQDSGFDGMGLGQIGAQREGAQHVLTGLNSAIEPDLATARRRLCDLG